MADLVEAIYDYQPQASEDMKLVTGQQIEVLEVLSEDWARGRNVSTGQEGVFPRNYVKKAEKKPEGFRRPPAPLPNRPYNVGSDQKSDSKFDNPQPFDESKLYLPPAPSWQGSQHESPPSQPPQYSSQQTPSEQYQVQQYQPQQYQAQQYQSQQYHQYQQPPSQQQSSQYLPQQYQPQQYQAPQQYYQSPQQYQQPQPPQQQQPQQQDQQQHGGRFQGVMGNVAKRFGDSVVLGAGATLGSDLMHKLF